jgi:hypothetical protein
MVALQRNVGALACKRLKVDKDTVLLPLFLAKLAGFEDLLDGRKQTV